MARKRNYNLDFLKILACIAVVGLHTLQKDLSWINSSLYYLCGFAVPSFFMASGYVLLNRNSVTWDYVMHKIIAILRVVIIWNIIALVYELVKNIAIYNNSGFEILMIPKEIVKSLLQRGMFWQFWYFGALIIIYFLLPALRNFARVKDIKRLWIIFVGFSIIIQGASIIVGKPLQKNVIQTFRIWSWIQYFVLGGILFCSETTYWGKKISSITMKTHTILLFVWSGLVVLYQNISGRYLIHNLYAEYFYDSIFTIVWLFLIFTFVMRLKFSGKCYGIIEKMVPLTMGIYIVHPLYMKIITRFIAIDKIWMSIVYFVVVLVVSGVTVFIGNKIVFTRKMFQL